MKKLIILLSIGIAVITGCMIYIIKNGVSLRLEPEIDPTSLKVGEQNIAKALLYRLTPQFQPASYIVIGFDRSDEVQKNIVQSLVSEFASTFHIKPNVIEGFKPIDRCTKPCWVLTDAQSSNQLSGSGPVGKNVRSTGLKYFTLTLLKFDRNTQVPNFCESQKRITFDCLTPLAVQEFRRKLKSAEKYFFVESYFEQDYFLFLEQ